MLSIADKGIHEILPRLPTTDGGIDDLVSTVGRACMIILKVDIIYLILMWGTDDLLAMLAMRGTDDIVDKKTQHNIIINTKLSEINFSVEVYLNVLKAF